MSSDMIDYLMGQPDGANYVVLYHIYTVRGALMALPSRVAINAAALSDPAEVAEYMRGEVNQIAEEIAMFRYDPAKYEARVRERKAWAEKLAGDDDE